MYGTTSSAGQSRSLSNHRIRQHEANHGSAVVMGNRIPRLELGRQRVAFPAPSVVSHQSELLMLAQRTLHRVSKVPQVCGVFPKRVSQSSRDLELNPGLPRSSVTNVEGAPRCEPAARDD